MAELEHSAEQPLLEQPGTGPENQRFNLHDRPGDQLFAQVAVCVYAVVVLAVLGVRPLWADELLQLSGARQGTWAGVIQWAQILPGGAPLPLGLQKLAILALGWSNWAVRLPAALFGIGSAVMFARIAKWNRVAVALFLTVPILFRYATEGRMYSEALFFVLLAWWARSRWLRIAAALGAVYSSPFAIFPLLAIHPLTAILAGVAFLPWWLVQRGMQAAQGSMSVYSFAWSQLSPLLLVREFTGGGFWCGVPLLILAGMGWRKRKAGSEWVMGASVMGPPVADAIAGYFFAARQWLFGLPPLILAASGSASAIAMALVCVFLAGALAKDVRQTFFQAEDWGAAAHAIRDELSGGGCLVVAPAEQIGYYAFYEPSLAQRVCAAERSGAAVLAASPYTTAAEEQRELVQMRVTKRRVVGTIRIAAGSYSR